MNRRAVASLAAAIALFACGGRTSDEIGDGGSPRQSGSSSGSTSGSGSGGVSGSGSGGVSGSGSGGVSGSGSGGFPVDASPVVDAIAVEDVAAPITCESTGGGGSGGNGSCSVSLNEACSDGNTYSIECDCPSAMCSCSILTGQMGGSSGGGISYAGCPSCSMTSGLWSLCGFPGQ